MRILSFCLVATCFHAGCATSLLETRMVKQLSFEDRVVNNFADAMKEDNEPALRRAVSTRFEQKALRTPTSFKELDILSLPKEKLTVVETDELDATSRNVVVSEPDGTKYQFKLVRDADKRRWVVDDVVSRQEKKGTRAARSSTEVMDLLLTLREFLATWENGSRDDVLKVVSTDLRSTLQELPEPWLKQLISRVTREYEAGMARRPEAQIGEYDAVVKVPAKSGFLLMKIDREGDSWLVADVEVHSRKVEDHPGSIRRQADAMKAVTGFLHGYQNENHEELKQTTVEEFYLGSLQFADLSMLPLPSPEHAPADFEIRAFSGQLTVMIPDTSAVIRLDLTEPEQDTKKSGSRSEDQAKETVSSRFLVREVTVYDRQTEQHRNLSSAFTAPTRAMLFMSSLEERDLQMLKQICSAEFSRGTWDRLTPDLTQQLPLGGLPTGELTLLNSRVRGTKTELEFRAQSGQLLNVLLSEENGYLRVDDVQYPNSSAEIVSLKTQLELVAPVLELADAWSRYDIPGVREACSHDFNRLVWAHLNALPADFAMLPELLTAPVRSTTVTSRGATLTLQVVDGRTARLQLLAEKGKWLVDEVTFLGPGDVTVDIRSTLRQDIAQQILANPAGSIQQAGFVRTEKGDPAANGNYVVHAHAESTMARTGNLTIPATAKPMASERPATLTATPAAQPDLPVSVMAAETTVVDGVVYFKGAGRKEASSPEAELPGTPVDLQAADAPSMNLAPPVPVSPVLATPGSASPISAAPDVLRRRPSDPATRPIPIPVK